MYERLVPVEGVLPYVECVLEMALGRVDRSRRRMVERSGKLVVCPKMAL